jgi:hypothetical protein
MTDRHIRILRLVAHRAQRELDDHHSVNHIEDTHLKDDVNTSSELRPGPERASRTPTSDGATDDQFPSPDLSTERADRTQVPPPSRPLLTDVEDRETHRVHEFATAAIIRACTPAVRQPESAGQLVAS